MMFSNWNTRKSSCMNARAIPHTAQQVLTLLLYLLTGYPIQSWWKGTPIHSQWEDGIPPSTPNGGWGTPIQSSDGGTQIQPLPREYTYIQSWLGEGRWYPHQIPMKGYPIQSSVRGYPCPTLTWGYPQQVFWWGTPYLGLGLGHPLSWPDMGYPSFWPGMGVPPLGRMGGTYPTPVRKCRQGYPLKYEQTHAPENSTFPPPSDAGVIMSGSYNLFFNVT